MNKTHLLFWKFVPDSNKDHDISTISRLHRDKEKITRKITFQIMNEHKEIF